jgi:hypothetical protein
MALFAAGGDVTTNPAESLGAFEGAKAISPELKQHVKGANIQNESGNPVDTLREDWLLFPLPIRLSRNNCPELREKPI